MNASVLIISSRCFVNVSDDEGGGGLYSKFGSKLSAGAMSLGKKAAQSEAGKKAGRAAIKGAADSARDDMMDRYFGPGGETSAPAKPAPSAAPKTPDSSSAPTSSPSKPTQEGGHSFSTSSSSSGQEWGGTRPPKPSLLDKLKFSKGSSQAKPRPRPVRDPSKKRVYKHRLAQSADWDRLPMAQALYNFKAEMKCDLEFRKGQVIYVITRTDSQQDWWEGKLEDRVGIFPANYVKMM